METFWGLSVLPKNRQTLRSVAQHTTSYSSRPQRRFTASGCYWMALRGSRVNFLPPPNKQAYYEQVWAMVRLIPTGKVATYGQIMKVIPKPEEVSEEDYKLSASRWVGLAMSACPADVPWHRVVNSQGKISHSSAAAEQKKRLEAEDVYFSGDKLNLQEYRWLTPGESAEPVQTRLF